MANIWPVRYDLIIYGFESFHITPINGQRSVVWVEICTIKSRTTSANWCSNWKKTKKRKSGEEEKASSLNSKIRFMDYGKIYFAHFSIQALVELNACQNVLSVWCRHTHPTTERTDGDEQMFAETKFYLNMLLHIKSIFYPAQEIVYVIREWIMNKMHTHRNKCECLPFEQP